MKLKAILTFGFLLTIFASGQEPVLLPSPPQAGTFFSAQLTSYPPWPINPVKGSDVYSYKNILIFDDRAVDYSSKSSGFDFEMGSLENEGPPTPGEGGEATNNIPPAYNYTTNDLWLEITAVTNDLAFLTQDDLVRARIELGQRRRRSFAKVLSVEPHLELGWNRADEDARAARDGLEDQLLDGGQLAMNLDSSNELPKAALLDG